MWRSTFYKWNLKNVIRKNIVHTKQQLPPALFMNIHLYWVLHNYKINKPCSKMKKWFAIIPWWIQFNFNVLYIRNHLPSFRIVYFVQRYVKKGLSSNSHIFLHYPQRISISYKFSHSIGIDIRMERFFDLRISDYMNQFSCSSSGKCAWLVGMSSILLFILW